MLAEFFDRIVGLARGAHSLDFKTHEQLPDTVFVRHAGELQTHVVPPPKRAHKLLGLDDLLLALRDPIIAYAPEVYVAGGRVCALLDRNERRSMVTIDLQETKRFQLCAQLQAQPRQFQPKDAVKMLRLELHGGNHEHVIQALSRIDFTRNSAGKSHVEHGRETLGRSVEAAVQQADNVPKSFTVGVPLWTTSGFTRYGVTVEFGVFLDLDTSTVELRVLSDEIERVRNLALTAVAKDISEALGGKVPVFMGSP